MSAAAARARLGRVAFTADRKTLVDALSFVNAIPEMFPQPYVHWLLLTASPEHVGVARNNGDQQYHAEVVGARCVTPGSAVVTARELAAAVSSMPANSGPVTVSFDGGKAFVAGAQSRVELAPKDVQEFADRMPDTPDASATAVLGLPSLRDAVASVAEVACGADPTTPLLTHVHVALPRKGSGWMTLLATDRFRAWRRDVEVFGQEGGFAALVPAAGLAPAVKRFAKVTGESVHMAFAQDAGRLVLSCGPFRAVMATEPAQRRYPVKPMDQRYMEARAGSSAAVDLPAEDVVAAVKRLAGVVRAARKQAAKDAKGAGKKTGGSEGSR